MDLVTFTEETLNGKLHFLCSEKIKYFCVPWLIVPSRSNKNPALNLVLHNLSSAAWIKTNGKNAYSRCLPYMTSLDAFHLSLDLMGLVSIRNKVEFGLTSEK